MMGSEIIKCRFVTYKCLVLALVLVLVLSVQLLSCREWIAAAITTPARDWFHQVQVNIEREEVYNSPDQSDRIMLRSASSPSSSGGDDDHVDNTLFPAGDADVWQCMEHRASYGRSWSEYWMAMTANASDQAALCAAHHAAKQPMAPGPPRIAFLFLVLDEVPLESLWRAFFKGHEGKYSLYVHPHHANHMYPPTSFFHGRKIPSKPLQRFSISEPAAVRRALAYALLDANVPNAWFTVQSETSIPVRPFPFVYDYLMGSNLSFVESFYPWDWWRSQWREDQPPQLQGEQMRKGEVWITVHRRHAGLIVGDSHVFTKFELAWKPYALSCEIYIPTLMHVADPSGIANRSVMYVNWSIVDSDHPQLFNSTNVNATLIRTIQEQRQNEDGMYTKTHYYGHENQLSCTYNGSPNASCWLFARKFAGGAANLKALLTVRGALGY